MVSTASSVYGECIFMVDRAQSFLIRFINDHPILIRFTNLCGGVECIIWFNWFAWVGDLLIIQFYYKVMWWSRFFWSLSLQGCSYKLLPQIWYLIGLLPLIWNGLSFMFCLWLLQPRSMLLFRECSHFLWAPLIQRNLQFCVGLQSLWWLDGNIGENFAGFSCVPLMSGRRRPLGENYPLCSYLLKVKISVFRPWWAVQIQLRDSDLTCWSWWDDPECIYKPTCD